jgi:hypothetical protein
VAGARATRGGACACIVQAAMRCDAIPCAGLHLPALFVDVDAAGEAVEFGLKDLVWFLFFGMPGTSLPLR